MKLTKNKQIDETVKALNPGFDYDSENSYSTEEFDDIPESNKRLLITKKPGALMQTLRDMNISYEHWRIDSIKAEVFIFSVSDGWYKTVLRASEKAELSEGELVATDA